MNRIIDTSQAAFIKNRFILDNVILSQEIIQHCQHNKEQGVVIKVDFEKAYDKINWSYLLDILKSRGFGQKWILWIREWLFSSQSCININGELTDSFFCKRGVRQGDPLSPYLYILAADTLSKLFHKGRHSNSLIGLGPPAIDHLAHTNCHYADDTIIFLKAEASNIEKAWWTLYAFEALSEIKVNYDKTSIYPIHTYNIDDFAQIFRCKPASFPFLYLGLPLHTHKLKKADWFFLIDKIEKKLQNWKGSLLSIGGRLILLNSVFSAVSLYCISIYKIPMFVIKKIDQIRCRFLWQGTTVRKKYSLLNWHTVCLAKEFGGLGILDLKQMNISLLMKWWWKLKDPSYTSAWKHMILTKYIFSSSSTKSEFWSIISSLDHLGSVSVQYTPGIQSFVLFWSDIWYHSSMATKFPYLFEICINAGITLQQVVNTQRDALRFRRSLYGAL